MEHGLTNLIIFIGLFLIVTSFIRELTKKVSSVPFTVALLILGLISQYLVNLYHLEFHYTLSPALIYQVLLPILLFESAMHLNFHQFRLQFKTITFLATFGLLTSMFIIGFGLSYLLNLPFAVSLMFGALISATDPIAVIALFKNLGAPKRLGLLADGESMFNDATAVIAFKIISAVVLINSGFEPNHLFSSLTNFSYSFIGSLLFGAGVGYIFSKVTERVQNDKAVEVTISIACALLVFSVSEHFFHLSGVISAVTAGLVYGNLGRTKVSGPVLSFMEEIWEYLAFLAISLVFFFATFNLDLKIFLERPEQLVAVILLVLVGRAASTYLTFGITNRGSLFSDEPNVPTSWQHILNWGGLRGVIPLVLVYSLPLDFAYRADLVRFTFATLLFTLFVNGTTIQALLFKFGLHLPKKEELIIGEEHTVFQIEEKKQKIAQLSLEEFDKSIVSDFRKKLGTEEKLHKQNLARIADPQEFIISLRVEVLELERKVIRELFYENLINERVYYMLESELDLQHDAIEYPEITKNRVIQKGGFINASSIFRNSLQKTKEQIKKLSHYRVVSYLLTKRREKLITDRFTLLRTRIVASSRALEYLGKLGQITNYKKLEKCLKIVSEEHRNYIRRNKLMVTELKNSYAELIAKHQELTLESYSKQAISHE